jgi:hypothetical protein
MTAKGQNLHQRHKAQVASLTPGRIRIRIHPTGRQTATMRDIRDNLATREGIHDVKTNESTGSIKINYDAGRYDAEGIRRVLEDMDVILSEYVGACAGEEASSASRGAVTFSGAVEDLTKRLSIFTGAKIDLKNALPLSLLGLGAWSIARNGMMLAQVPGWVFLWLAFDTYLKLHHPHTTAQ